MKYQEMWRAAAATAVRSLRPEECVGTFANSTGTWVVYVHEVQSKGQVVTAAVRMDEEGTALGVVFAAGAYSAEDMALLLLTRAEGIQ